MSFSTTRRRFIEIVPLAGVSLLAACGDSSSPKPSVVSGSVTVKEPVPAPKAAAAAASAPPAAPTAALPVTSASNLSMVDEKDPLAAGLGYVADVSRIDPSKAKTHQAGQACGSCALYGGQAGAASGPCPMFGGKQVSVTGWCSAYSKRG